MTDRTRDFEDHPLSALVLTGHRTEKLADPMREATDDVTVVSHTTDSLVRRFLRTLRDGGRAIRRDDIDVIVGDHGGVVGFAAVLLGLVFRRPSVIRIGGEIWRINREKAAEFREDGDYASYALIQAFRAMNRFTFALADGYLVLSEHLKKMIVDETGCDPEVVRVVGVPIDVEAYASGSGAAARTAIGIDAPRVLATVTNLRFRGKYRGIRAALPAVRRLLEEHDDLAYVVAGDGMYHEDLRRDIEELFDEKTRDRVHLPGFVENVPDLYAASDAVLYVSFIDGYGNVIRESQAAGVPVVSNNARGMRELVEDGETGVLVEPTPEAIYDAVNRLLSDPEERDRLAASGRTAIADSGDPRTVGEDIYRAIVELARRR